MNTAFCLRFCLSIISGYQLSKTDYSQNETLYFYTSNNK